MALLGSTVFFLLYRRLADKPITTKVHGPVALDTSAAAAADSPFRNPLGWSLVLLGSINMGGFSATFFVPSAVKTVFDLPPAKASQIISTSYIFAIFANLGFGYLCDRFNRWNMMLLLPPILLIACFTMMVPNLAVFWVSTALLIGLGLCATNQLYTLANELAGGKNVATVMGIASLGGGVFGYLGPQMLGYLRDVTGGFTAGWFFVAGGVLVSFFELLVLKRFVGGRREMDTTNDSRD
jgi:nitrate/nitrite transporter NarK